MQKVAESLSEVGGSELELVLASNMSTEQMR